MLRQKATVQVSIDAANKGKQEEIQQKVIHPRVLNCLTKDLELSPILLTKDKHQPLKGDLKNKCCQSV